MSVDPQILAVLEQSIAGLPTGDTAAAPLRVHVAGLYLSNGDAENALRHAAAALALAPSDLSALSIAGSAASALGRATVADAYRMMHAALLSTSVAPPEPPLPHEHSDGVDDADERDQEPRDPSTRVREPIAPPAGWDSDDPRRVTLADVVGMADVKARLQRSFLGPMANASLRDAFSKRLRGGLLLWGPPGTGKTFIARALSGELGASFYSATPADIYNSYFGESEGNIARLFGEARKASPAVVFLDELDALGGRRSARNTDQGRGVVNQLLTELDGMASNEGVYILAATNAPWDIDDALRRPGRFDRTVLVLPPDAAARQSLLTVNLADRPTAPTVDLRGIVRGTETYSGADLVRVVEAATERALERSVDLGAVSPITTADLEAALADTPSSTRQWLMTAATFVAHAVDGDDYRDLRDYLRAHRIS